MHIYHGLTWGPLVREIVSAATGQNIRDILAAEVLDPLGFRWTNYGVAESDVPLVAPSYVTGKPLPRRSPRRSGQRLGTMQQIIPFSNTPLFSPVRSLVEHRVHRRRAVPIRRDLAPRRRLDGVRIMRPETLRAAVAPCRRLRPDLATGLAPMRWGTGYMLGSTRFGPFGRDSPQHSATGLTNVAIWADPGVTCPSGWSAAVSRAGHREEAAIPTCWTASRRRFQVPRGGRQWVLPGRSRG